jgi:hypothetical protein
MQIRSRDGRFELRWPTYNEELTRFVSRLVFVPFSRYDGLSSVDDFQTFHHRGKAFAQWKLHGDFEAVQSSGRRGQQAERKSD